VAREKDDADLSQPECRMMATGRLELISELNFMLDFLFGMFRLLSEGWGVLQHRNNSRCLTGRPDQVTDRWLYVRTPGMTDQRCFGSAQGTQRCCPDWMFAVSANGKPLSRLPSDRPCSTSAGSPGRSHLDIFGSFRTSVICSAHYLWIDVVVLPRSVPTLVIRDCLHPYKILGTSQ
jgi:hypothetical protein